MHDLLNKRFAISTLPTPTGANGGPIDFNATGDKFIFTPVTPIDVYRWGLRFIDAVNPDAGGFVIALDYRPTMGSDTSRVEKDTITRADADTSAAGAGFYAELDLQVAAATGSDGSTVNVGPAGPLEVNPGSEVVIEVTNAAGVTATGYVWIEYVEKPFDPNGRGANNTKVLS